MDTQKIGNLGINRLVLILANFNCGWQSYEQHNDKGIDGFIILRRTISKKIKKIDKKTGLPKIKISKNETDSGEIIFAQVKTGQSFKSETLTRPNHYDILIGEEYINNHRPLWNRMASPAILIWVDDKNNDAYWTDLNSDDSYTTDNKGIALVPKSNKLDNNSRYFLKKLCGYKNKNIPSINLSSKDCYYINFNSSIKNAARKYYLDWKNDKLFKTANPYLNNINISRSGWRHLSRKSRSSGKVIQSWMLLGAAKIILQMIKHYEVIGRENIISIGNQKIFYDYIALKANVFFPFREKGLVYVVLRRKRTLDNLANITSETWFYSVFEKRRGLQR